MKYKIGEHNFKTKKDAQNFVRKFIINIGCKDIYPKDHEYKLLEDLINNHPKSKDKIGSGIKCFRIQKNHLNPKCLETIIERNDGSIIDFSWVKCSTSSSNSIIDNFKAAMRQYVSVDIQKFKRDSEMKCVFCDHIGDVSSDFHVDHDNPSFKQLCEDFIKLHPNYPKIFDDDSNTHISIFKKEDKEYADRWRHYHNEKAKLQILCAPCNLQKSKK